MNWVERRYLRETLPVERGQEVWADIRAALSGAVASYLEGYGTKLGVRIQQEPAPSSDREWAVRISRASQDGFISSSTRVSVEFSPNPAIIRVTKNDEMQAGLVKGPVSHPIVANDNGDVFVAVNNQRVSPDKFSQDLLETFLFHGFPDHSASVVCTASSPA